MYIKMPFDTNGSSLRLSISIASFAPMGRKSKLRRFAEVATFSNVFEHVPGEDFIVSNETGSARDLRGHWDSDHFQNDHPLILELACGKGDYTIALAKDNPGNNYIGVDIKGARIWKGARHALDANIPNAAFLRTRIEFIERFFDKGEIDTIWITFPDPFERKDSRRLTSPGFLDRYRKILKPGGIIHLKTDAWLLYEYTLDVIHADPRCKVLYANSDIYSGPLLHPDLRHHTYYERMHLADRRTIKYIRFTI
jgi:tRNA (guanine-N7-)-methyltransferase